MAVRAATLDDIRSMMRVSGAGLDDTLLQQWIERLGVRKEWCAVR